MQSNTVPVKSDIAPKLKGLKQNVDVDYDWLKQAIDTEFEFLMETIIYGKIVSYETPLFEYILAYTISHQKQEYTSLLLDLIGPRRILYDAIMGNVPALQKAIEKGVDINTSSYISGATPLMMACYGCQHRALKILIDAGADLHYIDEFNQNAYNWLLHDHPIGKKFASSAGKGAIIKMLLARKLQLLPENISGVPPLKVACLLNNKLLFEYLLNAHYPWNEKDDQGQNALMYTVNEKMRKLLLTYGCDINNKDNNMETVLFRTCKSARHFSTADEKIKFLIDNGAVLNIQNTHGYSPLMVLIQAGLNNTGLVELLLKSGCNPLLVANDGETALSIAINLHRRSCVVLLKKYIKIYQG